MKKYIDSDSMSETYAGRIDAAPSESLWVLYHPNGWPSQNEHNDPTN